MKIIFRVLMALSFATSFLPLNQTGDIEGQGGAIWYVATSGSDANTCNTPTAPCATITQAVSLAAAGDSIYVAEGSYTFSTLTFDKNISLSGGWDATFSTQTSLAGMTSTVDENYINPVIRISSGASVVFDHLSFVDSPAWLENSGTLQISNSVYKHNNWGPLGSYYGHGAIVNKCKLTIINTLLEENTGSNAGAIFNYNDCHSPMSLEINNSSIINNKGGSAGAIVIENSPVQIINTTISGNYLTSPGSYEYYLAGAISIQSGQVDIRNSTITNNSTMNVNNAFTGGIAVYSSGIMGMMPDNVDVSLANTILAGNDKSDCSGPIQSEGYNLIGDVFQCDLRNPTHDILQANAYLTALESTGNGLSIHSLTRESPALDGVPGPNCVDFQGNPLTTDQVGNPRPVDGDQDGNNQCDIGAIEQNPASITSVTIPAWYVSTRGNDSNSCAASDAPCQTIQAAINKASEGDTIRVASGAYTQAINGYIATIEKKLTIEGGWNESFSAQNGISTLDGLKTNAGFSVQNAWVILKKFTIENCLGQKANGGGISVSNSRLYLMDSIVRNNSTYSGIGSGGGIGATSNSHLFLMNSQVANNRTDGIGGGISADGGSITLFDSTIEGNYAASHGGGIGASDGAVAIYHSTIRNNLISSDWWVTGGGVYTRNVYAENSVFQDNVAPNGEGGGIFAEFGVIDQSSFINNFSGYYGGGVSIANLRKLTNSYFLGNHTLGDGGGVYGTASLVENTSFLFNRSERSGGAMMSADRLYNVTAYGNSAHGSVGGISIGYEISNSIIFGNQASNEADLHCSYGRTASNGHNIFGSVEFCQGTENDLIGVNPGFLYVYSDNTIGILPAPNSPAIDNGDPTGCKGYGNILLTTDQNGNSRAIDGNDDSISACDIGATEYDPAYEFPQYDQQSIFVSPTGNDSNPCTDPEKPCATINNALSHAWPGDVLYLMEGTYTGTGAEVANLNQNVDFFGGWNQDFSEQTGFSVINGQNTRRGLLIDDHLNLNLDHLQIINGLSNNGDGGGVSIGDGTWISFNNSELNNNVAGGTNFATAPVYNGGAIGMGANGKLYFGATSLTGNIASGNGGAVYANNSDITGNRVDAENNTANLSGGAFFSTGKMIFGNSLLQNNTAHQSGGAISAASLTLGSCSILLNHADGSGGGTTTTSGMLRNSILLGNTSVSGAECSGALASDGYNLLGDLAGCAFTTSTGDQTGADTNLAATLASGMALDASNPALDHGNPAGCNNHLGALMSVDLRGNPRQSDGNDDGSAICDIGALEMILGYPVNFFPIINP